MKYGREKFETNVFLVFKSFQKLERRLAAFGQLRDGLDDKSTERMKEILKKEYMSSDESGIDEEDTENRGERKRFLVRRLRWERKKLTNMKSSNTQSPYQAMPGL